VRELHERGRERLTTALNGYVKDTIERRRRTSFTRGQHAREVGEKKRS